MSGKTTAGPATLTDNSKQAAERRLLRRIMLLTLPLFLVVLVFLPGIGPLYRNFATPSTSMAPTIPIGSFHLVSRLSYGYSRHSFDWFDLPITGRWPDRKPARGDIVVFRNPKEPSTFYIKRLIGLPGDRVQLVKGRLAINGTVIPREPTKKVPHPMDRGREVATYIETLPEGVSYQIIETDDDSGGFDDTEEFQVPAGHYFFLGDNRDNSSDSRTPFAVGYVPFEFILGRVILTVPGDKEDQE